MAERKKSTKTSTKAGTKQETPTSDNSAQDNSSNYGSNDAMVFIGGVWANRDKNGELYLSGYFGSAKIFLFKNKKKTQDNQPDYYMQIANNTKNKNKSASADDLENEIAGTPDTDDIPF